MAEDRPQVLAVIPEQIPEELKEIPQWVVWAYELRGDRWTKPPTNPRTGRYARSTDPSTGCAFGMALRCARRDRYDGLGLIVSADLGLVAIDLDHCVADGVVAAWAARVAEGFASYTEFSPSGTGLRIIARATLPCAGARRGPVELYQAERYITVTGHRLPGLPEAPREAAEAALALLHHAGWRPTAIPAGAARPEPGRASLDQARARAEARLPGLTLRLLDSIGPAHYGSASEADSAIATALLRAGLSRADARAVILSHARGLDAARRKGQGRLDYYWDRTLERAESVIATSQLRGMSLRAGRAGRAISRLCEVRY